MCDFINTELWKDVEVGCIQYTMTTCTHEDIAWVAKSKGTNGLGRARRCEPERHTIVGECNLRAESIMTFTYPEEILA